MEMLKILNPTTINSKIYYTHWHPIHFDFIIWFVITFVANVKLKLPKRENYDPRKGHQILTLIFYGLSTTFMQLHHTYSSIVTCRNAIRILQNCVEMSEKLQNSFLRIAEVVST